MSETKATKTWMTGFISAIGEIAIWVEPAHVVEALAAGFPMQVENLTQVFMGPQGLGLRPLSKSCTIQTAHVVTMNRANEDITKHLSGAWSGDSRSRIVQANGADISKFGRR